MLACRAVWLRLGVRPDAFGNALGNGIADAAGSGSQQDGKAFLSGPDESAAETARLNAYERQAAARNGGLSLSGASEYRMQSGETFSDAYGPVSSFEPTADAALFGRGPVSTFQRGRTIYIGDDLSALTNEELIARAKGLIGSAPATGRSLAAIESMAQAYRDSGLSGATGDVQEFIAQPSYLGTDGRLYDTPQPPVQVIGRRMTSEQIAGWEDKEYGSIRAVEPSLWDRTWLNPATQQEMSRTPLGGLTIAAMNIAGTTVAGFRSDGYNFATGQHLNPVQRRNERINTVINLATLPIGAGAGPMIRGGALATKGPGSFVTVPESMSARAAAYQARVSGSPPGTAYVVGGVKFDGFEMGMLIDGKANYAQFVKDGQFRPWFTGADELVSQAQRQLLVARGTPIQWQFAEESGANATRLLFRQRAISGIEIIHVP